jgi:agmatine deiminase
MADQTLTSTPLSDGYAMPAEWTDHAGCWLAWPERSDNWRNGGKPAQEAFANVIRTISRTEQVTVVTSAARWDSARAMLPAGVRVIEMSYDDCWMRDIGPTFVVNDSGDVRGVDWDFNAWGGLVDGLYAPWDADDAVAKKVLEIERVRRYKAPFVLEGGSFDVDGEGTVLVTEECLLSEGRNPNLSKDQIEDLLRQYLGVSTVIWLRHGVYQDETNGHIDNFCRFVKPGVVMLTWTEDESDPQFERSAAALEQLSREKDAGGRSLEIVRIHQPGPITFTAGEAAGITRVEGTLPRRPGDRLAGSYVNSYIGNDIVVLPIFADAQDEAAIRTYQRLFPERRVITVPGREILLGGGNVHCITQQQPSGARS